jgi:y4mF family transcriptional regulator
MFLIGNFLLFFPLNRYNDTEREQDMKQFTDTKAIGEIIKQVRKTQGLTQEQLAAACGLGRRFIVELEGGKATTHVGKVMQVLSTLGISLHATDRKGDL